MSLNNLFKLEEEDFFLFPLRRSNFPLLFVSIHWCSVFCFRIQKSSLRNRCFVWALWTPLINFLVNKEKLQLTNKTGRRYSLINGFFPSTISLSLKAWKLSIVGTSDCACVLDNKKPFDWKKFDRCRRYCQTLHWLVRNSFYT